MDTHQAMQIFHSVFLIDTEGNHPEPYKLISTNDIKSGQWKFNAALSESLNMSADEANRHLIHYANQLEASGKYALTVWPYHAMLGGIGHALVSAFEEAMFFHTMARYSQPNIQVKGSHPLTEHYSVFGPEVSTDADGKTLVDKNEALFELLGRFDAVLIAGQAKSHCVAWTIADLLDNVMARDRSLVEKVYLLEDCTSPVVIPDVIDYTDEANAAFQRFSDAGMHLVQSTEPMESWPGLGISAT
jgi:nicotinamidase-related amidase